eukprot:TRINITY_DN2572_c0_g1_i10.p1 TRINITY_DN2572_c0_g1~~TRINITY_DN2572_c0_g1_i10.p1  ORF type:complete len:232 (+),score=26.77 TRINITY_DN2572_c0_g1_i10:621-1316(+)
MREQFIADLDDVDKDLIGRDVPDLTHRIVAVSDRTQFIKDMFDGLMTSTSEEPHVLHTSETLAQLVDKQGTNVLGFVHRTTWFDLTCNGSRMAYFMTIKVMPKSRHFITPQRMLSVATRAKKKRKTSANKQDIGPCRVVAAAAPALAAFQPEQQARVVEGGGCTFVPYVPPMQITANSSSTAVNEGSRLLPDGAELSQMFFALFGSTEGADSLFEDMEGRGLLDLLPIDFD